MTRVCFCWRMNTDSTPNATRRTATPVCTPPALNSYRQDSDVATDFQAALDTPAGKRKPSPQAKSSDKKENKSASGSPLSEQGEEEEAGDESDSEDEEGGGWGSEEF